MAIYFNGKIVSSSLPNNNYSTTALNAEQQTDAVSTPSVQSTINSTDVKKSTLILNECDSYETFKSLKANSQLNDNELYLFPDPIPTAENNVALLGADGRIIDSGKQFTTAGIGADPVGTGLYSFTAIPANSDLNDYTACGYYGVKYNSTVPTLSNCPVSKAFTMEVSNAVGNTDSGVITGTTSRYRIQRVTDYETREYARLAFTDSSGNVTFSTWKKMLTNDDWTALKAEITPASIGAMTADATTALSTLGIASGYWTPTLSGMSAYSYQRGRYVKIGDVAIVSFNIWGIMAGSNTEQIKISGCPLIPADGGYAGGGSLSGYYTDEDAVFTNWATSTDGSFYAYGQRTGSGSKWESSNIFQKTQGECGGGGTLMFKTSS